MSAGAGGAGGVGVGVGVGMTMLSQSSGSLHRLPGLSKAEKIGLLSAGSAGSLGVSSAGPKAEEDGGGKGLPAQNEDGMIDIPGKGWTHVFIARYSYDPFQHSPNEFPEAELQVRKQNCTN